MLGALVYRAVRWLCRLIPRRAAYGFARGVSYLCYLLQPARRRVVCDNLTHVTGDRGVARRLVRPVFLSFGMYLYDFFRSQKLTRQTIGDIVELATPEHVEESYKSGRGVICLTAHLGNWEIGGQALALFGYPVTAVVLPHSSPEVDELFLAERRATGLRPVSVGVAVRECYKALRRGEMVALVGDWDTTEGGREADFFGAPALMPRGPAAMAVRTGALILPGCTIRDRGRDFTIHTLPSFEPASTGDRERDEEETARLCRRALETFISRWPDQWFMFHRMWKDEG